MRGVGWLKCLGCRSSAACRHDPCPSSTGLPLRHWYVHETTAAHDAMIFMSPCPCLQPRSWSAPWRSWPLVTVAAAQSSCFLVETTSTSAGRLALRTLAALQLYRIEQTSTVSSLFCATPQQGSLVTDRYGFLHATDAAAIATTCAVITSSSCIMRGRRYSSAGELLASGALMRHSFHHIVLAGGSAG